MAKSTIGTLTLPAVLLLAGASMAPAVPARVSGAGAFLPTADKVPSCARLFVPPEDFEDPCGGAVKSNPQTSSDPRFVSCMAGMLINMGKVQDVKPEQASEAALITFESGAEMGVLAVSFADEQAATAVSAGLERTNAARQGSGPARSVVFRSGLQVAFAACDAQFDEACCQQMLGVLADTWKKP